MPAWPELPVPVDELVVCWALAGGSLACLERVSVCVRV
jgi:hypothetical protein